MKRILWMTALALAAALCAPTAQGQAGAEVWVQRHSTIGGSDDLASKVVADPSGNVIVVGTTDDRIAGVDMLTIKYSSEGTALWTNRYNGPGNTDDQARAVAVDGNGNVFVAGSSDGDYATIAYSSAGVALWTNRYSGPGNGSDYASALAVDGNGNVFVTGYSQSSHIGSDYATIAYSGAGMALWTNRYNGPGNDYDGATALAVDGNGNVFVTGYSVGSGSDSDYATIKYSGAGVPLWTNRYSGPGNGSDYASALAVDGSGNVFVTGHSWGNDSGYNYATIAYSVVGVALWTNRYNGLGNSNNYALAIAVGEGGNVFVTGSSDGDYATIAYSSAGVALWTNRYNGPGDNHDPARAVAVDGSGNVFVTGTSYDGNGPDYVTIAYSGAGVAMWTNRYNGPGNSDDFAQAMSVDKSGNVLVTGGSTGSDSGYDYATIAYSSAGVTLWTNRYNGSGNKYDSAEAMAVNASGNVFVTGTSYGGASGSDYVTIAYSGAGVALWTNRYNGPGNNDDSAEAVAVDESGNVFVTGSSVGTNGHSDYATIAYTSAGVALWTNRYSGPGNGYDRPQSVAVDGSGNVFVTGGSSFDYATIAYSGAGMALWTNRYDGSQRGDGASAVAVDGNGNVFVTGSSGSDYATIAYSRSGVALWTNRYNGPGNAGDRAGAMAVDGSGNVFVTGYSVGSGIDSDYATIKYSGAGVALWTNRYTGPGNGGHSASAMAVDRNGNVFVTGSSYDINGDSCYATIAYSGAGVALWTNRYNGPGNGNQASAVAVDGSGNVFVTGTSVGSGSDSDYATIAYTGAGVALWTNRYNGPANGEDSPQTIAIGPDGSVYVTGTSDGNYSNSSTPDFVTIKYVTVPSLTAVLSNHTLVVSWPQWTPPWRLEMQACSLSVGLGTNWMVVPGSNATNRMEFPVRDGAESGFFRLVSP